MALRRLVSHLVVSSKWLPKIFIQIVKEYAGIKGTLLDWFQDYLSNRKQCVVIPGAMSDLCSIETGVPQGSFLGPLLFLLYINDIVSEIGSNIRLFADDTSLYIVVEHPETAALRLNIDLEIISDWA